MPVRTDPGVEGGNRPRARSPAATRKGTGNAPRCIVSVRFAGYSPIVATAGCGRNIRPITSNLYWKHLSGSLYETFTIVSQFRHKSKRQFQQDVELLGMLVCTTAPTKPWSNLSAFEPI